MEMVQFITITQDVFSLTPGMAAGNCASPKTSREGDDPLLFAALLQEMMPAAPAAAGAEPADTATQQVGRGKGSAPGKSKSAANIAAGAADQGNGADEAESLAAGGSQLAQLLAMAVRMPEGEFPLQNGGNAADAGELDNSVPRQSPQASDRQFVKDGETPAESAIAPTKTAAAPAPEQIARPPQNFETSSGVMQAGIESGSPMPSTFTKLDEAAAQSGTPSEPVVHSTLRQLGPPADRQGIRESETPMGTAVAPAKTAASPVPLTSEALAKVPKDPLPPGGGGLGWGGSWQVLSRLRLHPPPNPLPLAGRSALQRAVPSREGEETFARGSSAMPFAAAPQSETAGESATPAANRTTATAERPRLFGLEPPVPEERAPLPSRAGAVAGTPAETLVEVVFADPSGKGGFPEEGKNDKSGAKDKVDESFAGPGVAPPRSFAMAEPNRPAMQPLGDEAGKRLNESILSQVRESVVSHDGKGNGRITVRLNPAELGELQVNVRIENHQVKVEIITDSRTVRDALLGNMDTLKETLLKQNLTMERFDVSTGGGNGFSQGFRDERGGERYASRLPFGPEAGQPDLPVGRVGEEWGVAQNSLVDLRL